MLHVLVLHVLDAVLIAMLVVLSAIYVIYSFASPSAKRRMLSWVARYCGVRVMTWLLPKNDGCTNCAANREHHGTGRPG